ncbi:hypothetical protein OAH02_01405 [Flavobacteriaceae bacterium]|nr:hypothetical protein [Flavobacteriaceae bacterium]
MAEVTVQFKDDFGCFKEIDEKIAVDKFLDEFKNEIPVLSDSFYIQDEDGLLVLQTLEGQFLSTRDNDELSKSLINFLSTISNNSENSPSFSLGGSNLSKEFFKNLYEICDDISFSVTVVVVGYPGYYDVTYEIAEDGWNVPYCDFYEEDGDEDW